MTDRINIQTVEGRQKLIAKLEDINAGLHQLDLHVMHLDRELDLLRSIVSAVWRDGMSIYDPAVQRLVEQVEL
jgi:hypothetical protein